MTYIKLYELCRKHNIKLIEEHGKLRFFYLGTLCGIVSTRITHERKVIHASAKDGVVTNLMQSIANTRIVNRGPR